MNGLAYIRETEHLIIIVAAETRRVSMATEDLNTNGLLIPRH